MPTTPHFSKKTLGFLRDLTKNNEREWFKANKSRYEEDLKDPALQFILDFAPRLAKISAHFRADPRPVGGSLFRIYRDTRFSKDKSPYKTHLGIHFRHERAKDAHAPGFYLHIEPKNAFVGVGIWHPDSPTTLALREAIVDDPDGWKKATRSGAFSKRFALAGDSLKRAPRGFDPEHPLIEDLKRKDFIGVTEFDPTSITSPDFLNEFAKICRAGAPLNRWITGALGLEW